LGPRTGLRRIAQFSLSLHFLPKRISVEVKHSKDYCSVILESFRNAPKLRAQLAVKELCFGSVSHPVPGTRAKGIRSRQQQP